MALFFVSLGILHQIPRITDWMPRISDQIIAVFHHIAVGPDDSSTFRDSFHPRWVERTIKTGRCWGRAVIRMIREQQRVNSPVTSGWRFFAALTHFAANESKRPYLPTTKSVTPYSVMWRSTSADSLSNRVSGASRCPIKKQVDIVSFLARLRYIANSL